jgi:ATP-dependent helicase YprA (DUF1998 family)
MTLVATRPFEDLLAQLSGNGELVHLERLAARPARHRALHNPVSPELLRLIPRLDGELWTHQASAIDLVRSRQSVVVATGTASGKSLVYQSATLRLRWSQKAKPQACCCFQRKRWRRISYGHSVCSPFLV